MLSSWRELSRQEVLYLQTRFRAHQTQVGNQRLHRGCRHYRCHRSCPHESYFDLMSSNHTSASPNQLLGHEENVTSHIHRQKLDKLGHFCGKPLI